MVLKKKGKALLLFPHVPSGKSLSENRPRARGAVGAAPTHHATVWHFISRTLGRRSEMRAKWAAGIIIINDEQKCD